MGICGYAGVYTPAYPHIPIQDVQPTNQDVTIACSLSMLHDKTVVVLDRLSKPIDFGFKRGQGQDLRRIRYTS